MIRWLPVRILWTSERVSCQQRCLHSYDGWYERPSADATKITKDTTVIICGWAQANPRHVKAYTKMYASKMGIGAHGYIMPMEITYKFDQTLQSELARQCLERVAQQNTGKNIILHCFSNNGFAFYRHLSILLKDKPHDLNLRGAIMDSNPGPMSKVPYLAQRLGSSSLHDTPRLLYPFSFLAGTYGFFLYTIKKEPLVSSINRALRLLPQSRKNYRMHNGPLDWAGPYLRHVENESWPLLFLYSKTDWMMPHTYVSLLIDSKKKQNPSRHITSKLFEKAQHVSIMMKHPEEYQSELVQFFSKIESENSD